MKSKTNQDESIPLAEDDLPQCKCYSSKSVVKYRTFKDAQLSNARFSWIVVDA